MLLFLYNPPRHSNGLARACLRLKRRNLPHRLRQPLPKNLTFLFRRRRKEKYPIFINMSQQQYRNERARVLRKLIGRNCKTLREYRGLTIKQVAEGTKISVCRLKKLETGQVDVTAPLLIAICDYFEVITDCMAHQDLSIEQ
jgi:hypothetical protein